MVIFDPVGAIRPPDCGESANCESHLRYSRYSPSDEWFRHILSMTDENSALEAFGQAVRTALDALYQLGRLPEVLDVAIDMHLIPCHSKKLGSDLRGGKSKSGTNRFETYITAQCVNPESRSSLRHCTWTNRHPCTNPCVKPSICAWKTSLQVTVSLSEAM